MTKVEKYSRKNSNNDPKIDDRLIISRPSEISNTRLTNKSTKYLIILSILCTTLLVLLFFTLLRLYINHYKCASQSKLDHTHCKTSTCYKASNFLLSNLNQTFNPCDDFYQFTCGNWIESSEHEEKDHFTIAYEKMLQDVSEILSSPISEREESKLVSNFKRFYRSCIDQTDVEFNSDIQLFNLIKNDFGSWPLVPSLDKSHNENIAKFSTDSLLGIEEHLFRLTHLDMPLIFRFESNDFNHTKILMQIVITSDFCKIQNFLPNNTKTKKEFFNLMKTIRNYMFESINGGMDFNTASKHSTSSLYEISFDEQVEEMLALASQVYFVNDTRYLCGRRSGAKRTTHVFSIDELNEKLNNDTNSSIKYFDFKKYADYYNKIIKKSVLNEKSQIVISSLTLKFLKDLFHGLRVNLNFTPTKFKRSLLNLIYFNSIFSLIKPLEIFSLPHLHLRFPIRYYHSFFEYSKHINHIMPLDNFKSIYRINREQNCAYTVIEIFSIPDSFEQTELQRLFVKTKFDPNVKDYTNKILENLKKTSFDLIEKLEWIDSNIKGKIKIGIKDIEFKLVYSDKLFDESNNNLNSYTYDLTDQYIVNLFIIRKKKYVKEFDLLNVQQINRVRNKKYIFDIFLANLMYLKEYNTLIMPAGILIEPIFSLNNPIYLNYATIGAYLAHEIWHMIHEEVIKSDASRIEYENKLMCLRDNYVKFVHHKYGYEIDGYASLIEQIADNYGVVVALKSYLNLLKNYENNKLLPGINYNQNQLFFIKYAVGYCRRTKPKKSIDEFEQFHAVHEFRALQVTLIPEFSHIFECKNKQQMSSFNDSRLDSCKIFELDLF